MGHGIGNGIYFEAVIRDLFGRKLYKARANTADVEKIRNIGNALKDAFGVDLTPSKRNDIRKKEIEELARIKSAITEGKGKIEQRMREFLKKCFFLLWGF